MYSLTSQSLGTLSNENGDGDGDGRPSRKIQIQLTPDNSNLQGKLKKVRVIGSSKKIAGSKGKKTVFTAQ